MSASERITSHIESLADWRGTLLARVRRIIGAAGPELVEEWKWGTPVWSGRGNVIAIGAFAEHVKINFFKGAALKDPKGLFNAGLEAEATRGIDFREGDRVDEAALKALCHGCHGLGRPLAARPRLAGVDPRAAIVRRSAELIAPRVNRRGREVAFEQRRHRIEFGTAGASRVIGWTGVASILRRAHVLQSAPRRDHPMGMAAPIYHTADQVRALPEDGHRHEVVHGELLVTPAPRALHQEVVRRLLVRLSLYLDAEPAGHVLPAPADISWGPDTLVQPDVFVVRLEQARTLDWSRMKDLLLVVEVLSPSSARADRFTKRIEYQRQGIPQYWIVDPEQYQVEIWTPGDTAPRLERERLLWHPAQATQPFELELKALFRPI